jgi:hypothetical protein
LDCHFAFHIISPSIKCGQYKYDSKGNVECNDISAAGSEPTCGFEFGGSNPYYTVVKNLIESPDRTLFGYQSGQIDRIYFPTFDNKYLGDLKIKSHAI